MACTFPPEMVAEHLNVDAEAFSIKPNEHHRLCVGRRPIAWNCGKKNARRNIMRAFIAAALIVLAIAVGAAWILDDFVQQSVTEAFAEPTARVP